MKVLEENGVLAGRVAQLEMKSQLLGAPEGD